MGFSLAIDLVILLLLGVCIFYAVRLSRQLAGFKKNKEDFIQAIHEFNRSTQTAESAVQGLKFNADEIAKKLKDEIDEAQKLFDELHFMNDAGNNLAKRLEKLAEKANKSAAGEVSPREKPTSAEKNDTIKKAKGPMSKAEEELMQALKDKKK